MEEFNNQEATNENVNFESRINLAPLLLSITAIKAELGTVIVGQSKMIDQMLVAILSNGHVLLEGVPGVAKRLLQIIGKNTKRWFQSNSIHARFDAFGYFGNFGI